MNRGRRRAILLKMNIYVAVGGEKVIANREKTIY
jgi:hypothetical protein